MKFLCHFCDIFFDSKNEALKHQNSTYHQIFKAVDLTHLEKSKK